jgi:hypothetical protein
LIEKERRKRSEWGHSLRREKSSEKNTDPFAVKFNTPYRAGALNKKFERSLHQKVFPEIIFESEEREK